MQFRKQKVESTEKPKQIKNQKQTSDTKIAQIPAKDLDFKGANF